MNCVRSLRTFEGSMMKKENRRFKSLKHSSTFITLLSVSLAAILVCLSATSCAPPPPTQLAKVRIIDPLEANNLHVPLAVEMGFFKEEGLDPDVTYTSAGKLSMDALQGGAK